MKRVNITTLVNSSALLNSFFSDMKNAAVAVVPTDTVYGFFADASSKKAVKRIYEIKARDKKKPLILFLSDINELSNLQIEIPNNFVNFLNSKWPGPLTVILNKPFDLEIISAFEYNTIGVRIPAHKSLLALMKSFNGYFLTTSVNKSGQQELINADEIEQEFHSDIDWLIENDIDVDISIPSTIIDLTQTSARILRKGKLEIDENMPDKL